MKIQTFADAKKYLYTFIPRGMKQKFPGDLGLRRAKYLLKLLGNPQNQIKVIHVAGTSGKGSTSYLISILLKALGFRVGFHVSPFIADIRERCQINNNLIPEKEFCKYLNDLIPYIDKVRKVYIDGPTYFEVVTVLAYYIFAKKKVDYAVIETGMGGWYDATNCVTNENKIAVITRIGYDHTSILGETLDKIALQKAMITQEKNTVVSLWQDFRARKVIEKVATKKHSQLFYIKKNVNFKNLITSAGGTSFDFNFLQTDFKNLKVGLIGTYQAENCSLALATVIYLSKKENFQINEKKIRLSLKGANFAARFEVINYKNKKIIVDGAHNPQKMLAFTSDLKRLFPKQKLNFLIAFKIGKDYKTMLKYIIPLAKNIIITNFFYDREDLIHLSEDPKEISSELKKLRFKNSKIMVDPKKALSYVIKSNFRLIVITGSLYLIGSIYADLKKKTQLVKRLNVVTSV